MYSINRKGLIPEAILIIIVLVCFVFYTIKYQGSKKAKAKKTIRDKGGEMVTPVEPEFPQKSSEVPATAKSAALERKLDATSELLDEEIEEYVEDTEEEVERAIEHSQRSYRDALEGSR